MAFDNAFATKQRGVGVVMFCAAWLMLGLGFVGYLTVRLSNPFIPQEMLMPLFSMVFGGPFAISIAFYQWMFHKSKKHAGLGILAAFGFDYALQVLEYVHAVPQDFHAKMWATTIVLVTSCAVTPLIQMWFLKRKLKKG